LEGALELSGLCIEVYLAENFLAPRGLYIKLLVLPIIVAGLKLIWCLRLALAYCRVHGRDLRTAIDRMCGIHSRACWSWSAAMLTCMSCVLMVWHAIMFLLMTSCSDSPHRMSHQPPSSAARSDAVKVVLGVSALFVIVNWALWRDFVAHCEESQDDAVDLRLCDAVFQLHKSGTIRMRKYQGVASEPSTSCVVCLQEFDATESVASLPCGHVFHPTCLHKWILQDWRCPFRCALDSRRRAQIKPQEPHAPITAWPPREGDFDVDMEAGR